MTPFLLLQVFTFGFAMWFGLYLLARDLSKPGLRFAGLGLVAYAVGLAADLFFREPTARYMWLFVPSVYWFGAAAHLLPDVLTGTSRRLNTLLLLLPPVIYAIGLMAGSYWLFAVVPVLFSLLTLGVVWRALRSDLPQRPLAALFTATIFFALGVSLLIFPVEPLPGDLMLLAVGVDLALLGYAIAVMDAYQEGESFLRDFLRSLGISLFTVLLFSAQMAVIIGASTDGLTSTLLLVLLATITTAIALQTFSDAIQLLLDRVIFARLPRLRQARADLRAAASALPRLNNTLDLQTLDDAEFTRLTRRALSHMGDLHRLASNPLTRLPAIDARLAAHGRLDNTLERAAELKSLLAESIDRLKPRGKGEFGISDEWRYYNALYFPYVVGLKPYSRRDSQAMFDPAAKEALDWFSIYVPERTLHNWQNAAAKLIAQDLREGQRAGAAAPIRK